MITNARESYLFKQFRCALLHVGSDLVVETERAEESRFHDLACAELGIDIVRPRRLNQTNPSPQRRQIGLTEFFTQHTALARGRPQMAGDDARQRAFAAAVGTENRRTCALANAPIDSAQNPSLGPADADA